MTSESKEIQVQEQEIIQDDGRERIRSRATFIPRADIYETEDDIVVSLDMPGVSEDTIDITLEKNVLSINGNSDQGAPEGFVLAFAEFESGDYERSFRLTDQIKREDIDAVYKDGVLKLILPKVEEAKARKIRVKTG